MLAGREGLLHQGPCVQRWVKMATASTSDASSSSKLAHGPVQAPSFRGRGGAFGALVHYIDLADTGVELEEVGELAAELADAYYSD